MKKYIIALLLGSLIGASQLQAQVVLQALEGGSNARATIQNIVIERLSFHTTQGKITTQNITIPYTNGMGSFSGISLSEQLTNGENNDTNIATLSISSGQFSNSGNITARLTIDGDGEYLIKKNDNGEVIDLAIFNVNLDGTTFKIILRSRGGWRATATYSDTERFTRDNCGYNYTAGSVWYTGTATGTGTSTISYADALNKAEQDAQQKYQQQGQAYANRNASCTYNPPAPTYRYFAQINSGYAFTMWGGNIHLTEPSRLPFLASTWESYVTVVEKKYVPYERVEVDESVYNDYIFRNILTGAANDLNDKILAAKPVKPHYRNWIYALAAEARRQCGCQSWTWKNKDAKEINFNDAPADLRNNYPWVSVVREP